MGLILSAKWYLIAASLPYLHKALKERSETMANNYLQKYFTNNYRNIRYLQKYLTMLSLAAEIAVNVAGGCEI